MTRSNPAVPFETLFETPLEDAARLPIVGRRFHGVTEAVYAEFDNEQHRLLVQGTAFIAAILVLVGGAIRYVNSLTDIAPPIAALSLAMMATGAASLMGVTFAAAMTDWPIRRLYLLITLATIVLTLSFLPTFAYRSVPTFIDISPLIIVLIGSCAIFRLPYRLALWCCGITVLGAIISSLVHPAALIALSAVTAIVFASGIAVTVSYFFEREFRLRFLDRAILLRERARLLAANRQLQHVAVTDPLTNLANRRRFDTTLDAFWEGAVEDQSPIAVLLLDLDHFKGLNDRLGHQVGDAVLRQVARVIADRTPAGALAARWGGEEFAIVLPGFGAAEAHATAERMRVAIEALRVPAIDPRLRVSVSIGVASMIPDRMSRLGLLVRYADTALYQAKEQGRNRVILFHAPSETRVAVA